MPLDEEVIAYVCRETLAGLAYLHSIGKVSFEAMLRPHDGREFAKTRNLAAKQEEMERMGEYKETNA